MLPLSMAYRLIKLLFVSEIVKSLNGTTAKIISFVGTVSGNILCHVYTIKSDMPSSDLSESQCQSCQTVTVSEWPKGGLSFSEPEENEVRDAQLVSTDGCYRLNLRQ